MRPYKIKAFTSSQKTGSLELELASARTRVAQLGICQNYTHERTFALLYIAANLLASRVRSLSAPEPCGSVPELGDSSLPTNAPDVKLGRAASTQVPNNKNQKEGIKPQHARGELVFAVAMATQEKGICRTTNKKRW